MTEVGVSLALRRHRSLIGFKDGKTKTNNNTKIGNNEKRKRLRSKSPGFSSLSVDVDSGSGGSRGGSGGGGDSTKKKSKNRIMGEALPSYSSWRVLFEGAALYIFCMVLPNLLAISARLYLTLWRKGTGYICSLSWLVESQSCQRYLPDNMQQHVPTNSSVLAPDAGISDVAIVIFLSLSMAVTRVALVHFLVPNYKQPKRLEALVRCKSIHLLSSSYPGSVTPTKAMQMRSFSDRTNALAGFHIPNLNDKEEVDDYDHVDNDDDDDDDDSYHQRETANHMDIRPKFPSGSLSDLEHTTSTQPGTAQDQRTGNENSDWLFHDDYQGSTSEDNWLRRDEHNNEDDYYDEDESHFQAPAVSSGLLTNTSALNLQALLEQAAPQKSSVALQRESGHSSTNKETTDRIFAAPKYATAVFRLIFCLVSCLIGLCYFWAADFWPPAVGGTGNTRNCWDLSSVGVTLMNTDFDKIVDSDFDSYNPVLRRYYIIQASYHFHSAAFHVLTSILLWFVSKSSKKKESLVAPKSKSLGFIQTGMFTLYNIQIFFQHIFSLVLILATYLFSSTRRLGAIAMFSFDASSLFLHLLQLRINAPQQRKEEKKETTFGHSRKLTILILHRFLVIPAFCYARFYVFPLVVFYSAMEESQDWLQQLENMLIPGTAKLIHGFFVIAFLLFMLMNLIYFWRLLNHPHVMDALQRQRGDDHGKKSSKNKPN